MSFPATRLRRLRRTDALRGIVREGSGPATPIPSLSEQYHHSIETLVEEARAVQAAGVPAVILFGIPDHKDEAASSAYDEEGIVQLGLRAIRMAVPELVLITDVCLCQYTSHGHSGVLRDGDVDNDLTPELLAQTAVSHAAAGADIVAPSDMMDGRVAAIRAALDADGLTSTAILAYSAKFASSFYGPFREAAHSTPSEGDRRGYQMDPANANEALRDERAAALEALTAIKRAGADMIITYLASRAAGWLS